MIKRVIISLTIIMLIGFVFPQDITNTLGGNTSSEVFDVEDSDNNTLLRVQGDGGAVFLGTFGTGTIPATGAGTRMMWYPKKAAFRAGYVHSDEWNDVNIGEYSVAIGFETKASGIESCVALGQQAVATQQSSVAIGRGANSAAANASAIGFSTLANGQNSTAIGNDVTSNGNGSMAMGYQSESNGSSSISIGTHTSSDAYRSMAVGSWNIGGGNPTSWVDSDPLFEIGNGHISTSKGNAMTVLKNGNVGIGTSTPGGTLDVNGTIYQRGSSLHADYVFEDDYELESIQKHSEYMWTNKHLPAIPKAKVDDNGNEIVEVGSHRKGIVEELEKAHIYISQLEERITKLEDLLTD